MTNTIEQKNRQLRLEQVLQKIKNIRQSKSISQTVLANNIGMSQNAYSKIELGHTQLMLKHLYGISDVLEVPIETLLAKDQ